MRYFICAFVQESKGVGGWDDKSFAVLAKEGPWDERITKGE